MYEDNNYKISVDWKGLLLKLVLVVIAILLIVWLFPMPKLDTFYNRIYNDNIASMKSAAENYYKGNNLPDTTGKSVTMSLQDMLDKKIITSFTDKDNKECSATNSYAQVTKTDNSSYVLKVQLSCDDKTDYILENLDNNTSTCTTSACKDESNNTSSDSESNDSSSDSTSKKSNNNINNEEDDEEDIVDANASYDKDGNKIMYQYKKAVTKAVTSYTCPDGYVKENNICYKSSSETIPATPMYFEDVTTLTDAKVNTTGEYTKKAEPTKSVDKTEKVCPEGYTLNNNICYKYTSVTVVPGTTSYTCPDGYTLNGTKCTKEIDATKHEATDTSYYCNEGTLSGTKCIVTTTPTTTTSGGSTSCSCPSGYSEQNGSCIRQTSYAASRGAGQTYCSCPSGYSEQNGSCVRQTSYQASRNTSTSSSCPSGYTPSGNSCVRTTTTKATLHPATYGCPAGYTPSGNSCVKYTQSCTTKWSNPSVSTSHSALSTYSNSSSKRVLANKSCKLGKCTYTYYTYTASKSCKNNPSYAGKVQTKGAYSTCSSGKQSGSNCVITQYANKQTNTSYGSYYCPNGGNLSGTSCVTTQYANKSCQTSQGGYYCPNGGTLNGSTCTTTQYANKSCSTTPGTSSTSCPFGFTQNGNTCTKTTQASQNTTGHTTYTCPDGYTLSGSKCTKQIDATPKTTETKYTCPTGYVKEGTTCYQYTEVSDKVTYKYTCPDGYTTAGEGEATTCTMKIEATTTYYCENADETLVGTQCQKTVKGALRGYSCPDGYILNNDTCTKKTTDCFEAQKVTNTSVSYEYKWSEESSLDGWEQTGKTKTEKSTTSTNLYSK